MEVLRQSKLGTPQRIPAAHCAGRSNAEQSVSGRNSAWICSQWLFILFGAIVTITTAGCAAEEKKPQTVTEWMQQRRVGEDER